MLYPAFLHERDFFVASKKKPQIRQKKRNRIAPVIRSSAVTPRSAGRSGTAGRSTGVVTLIKAGVERFILENATMEEFLRTLRLAGEPENLYTHQLTGSVLTRIVRRAISKRKPKPRKAGRQ
jgi:hypothetical protein